MDPAAAMADFNEEDKKQMKQFLDQEQQKAKFQENIHSLTAICWPKCITGGIKSGQVESGEQSCLVNCVNRFIDAQKVVVKNLEGSLR